MKSHFFRRSLTSCTKRARSFTALLSGLCLLSSGLAASADLTNDVHQIGINLETLLADLNTYSGTLDGDLVAIQNQLSNYLQPLHQDVVSGNTTLSTILTALNGSSDSSLANRLRDLQYMIAGGGSLYQSQNVFDYLNQIAQNTAHGGGTNFYNVQIDARDILAGNPWWATNSAFALTRSAYQYAYPNEVPNRDYTFSFPQFLSKWSSTLTQPMASGNAIRPSDLRANWWGYFGSLNRGFNANYYDPYTWFDWMADAMRSNIVLQAAASSNLQLIASLDPSVNVTNLVTYYSTNLVSVVVTNAFNADDILAANPYWATNSVFAHVWDQLQYVIPYIQNPTDPYNPQTFPEAFSQFLAMRTMKALPPPDTDDGFYALWGQDGFNWHHYRVWTWEDWLAEWLKSNQVLTSSTSSSNLAVELYEAGYDTDDVAFTNSPLPEYSLPDDSLSEASDALQQGETAVEDFIDSLPKPGTGGDPEIVVIPEFTIGGIHVQEYRASLSSSIVPVCRQVLTFLYGVSLFCGIFVLAKAEYAFWVSWGRYWDRP